MINLLMRFYDVDSGAILIDDVDITAVNRQSLRSRIGMVLQDTLLFSTSIRENIAYGREGATEAEIIQAAKRAQAYDFIMARGGLLATAMATRGGVILARLELERRAAMLGRALLGRVRAGGPGEGRLRNFGGRRRQQYDIENLLAHQRRG